VKPYFGLPLLTLAAKKCCTLTRQMPEAAGSTPHIDLAGGPRRGLDRRPQEEGRTGQIIFTPVVGYISGDHRYEYSGLIAWLMTACSNSSGCKKADEWGAIQLSSMTEPRCFPSKCELSLSRW